MNRAVLKIGGIGLFIAFAFVSQANATSDDKVIVEFPTQASVASTTPSPSVATVLENTLRSSSVELELQEVKQQLQAQQQRIESLELQLRNASSAAPKRAASTQIENAVWRTAPPAAEPVSGPQQGSNEGEKAKTSPLSFRIGGAEFTPGGFVDLSAIFRSTNVASGIGTSFGAIPFNNTAQGQLSEVRFTSQLSRLSLKVTDQFGANNVTGYMEMDFNGNDAANAFTSTNPHTDRLRLYWIDLKRGKWEILAGQSWGWLTPNRIGLSPDPSDIFNTRNVDNNYQVGLGYSRAAQFRVAYHPNDHWGIGLAVENPEQFVGGAVTFPSAFSAALTPQLNNGANTTTPNLHPDIIPKIAYDTDLGGKHFHAEVAGLLTSVKALANPAGGESSTAPGGGVSTSLNYEVVKGVRLIATGFYSDGGGRYINALAPDAVVRPDGAVSLVHTGSGVGGVEYQATSKTSFAAYYGGAYFQRNFFLDTTSTAKPKPFVGYGGPNSPSSANRAIQEGTLDWLQTFFKSPQYGTLQLNTQYSYLTRSPWFVAPAAPRNARLGMAFVALRYVLP
jgi:hypothetical protein